MAVLHVVSTLGSAVLEKTKEINLIRIELIMNLNELWMKVGGPFVINEITSFL